MVAAASDRLEQMRTLARREGIPLSCADRLTLRPREISGVTGFSLNTVYRWIRGGHLEVIEADGALAVYVTDLLNFLDDRRALREQEEPQSTEERAKTLIERSAQKKRAVR